MAQNSPPSEKLFVYKSSLASLKIVGGITAALAGFFLLEALYYLVRYHSDDGGMAICAEHFIFAAILGGAIFYGYATNRDRFVTITRTQIACTAPGKTFSIPMSQLTVIWPKRGVKKKRQLTISNGAEMFVVSEVFFPEFDDLLVKLKAFDKAKEAKRKEVTLTE